MRGQSLPYFGLVVNRVNRPARLTSVRILLTYRKFCIGSVLNKKWIFWIFVLALALRLGLFIYLLSSFGETEGLFWIDSRQYTDLAKNLLQGHGFTLNTEPPFAPDFLRTPGYPAFVAIFYSLFGNLWSAALAQVFLNAGTVVLAMWLASRLTNQKKAVYLAGILTAIEPHLILYTISLSTEGLFIPVLFLFAVFMVRYFERLRTTDIAMAGGCFVVCAITRPVFAYFIPFFLVFILFQVWKNRALWKRILLHAGMVSLMAVMTLGPWIYRNYRASGVATLSTIGWVNVYTRLALGTQAAGEGRPWGDVYEASLRDLQAEGVIKNQAEVELYDARFIPLLRKRSFEIIARHPFHFLMLQPVTAHALFTHDALYYILNRLGFDTRTGQPPFSPSMVLLQKGPFVLVRQLLPYIKGWYLLPIVARIVWYSLFLSAAFGVWCVYRVGTNRQKQVATLFLVLISFFTLTILPVAVSTEVRYRVSFEGMYFAFSSIGIVTLIERLTVWRRRRRLKGLSAKAECLLCGTMSPLEWPAFGVTSDKNVTEYQITESDPGKHFDMFRCSRCGSVFQPFPGGRDALELAYAAQPEDTEYLSEEQGRRKSFHLVLKRLGRMLPVGSLLEIGSGPGLFLAEAKRLGWHVRGIEPSKQSVQEAKNRYGLEIEQGTIGALKGIPDASFEAVAAFDVIEHLVEPGMLLSEAHRILKPGGIFVWTTPKYDSALHLALGRRWYNIHPYHLVYFTSDSVTHALGTYGFHLERQGHFKRYFSLRYLIHRLRGLLPAKLVDAIKGSPTFAKPIPVQLFDEFELYFRKK